MIAPADLAACREAIRTGSRSFHVASKLLPASVRDPALALYAFCRLADDAVDLDPEKPQAVLGLRDRLDRVYVGRPLDTPADRAFAAVVADYDMPRALPEALLEGFAWDATGRRYATLSDLRAYAARVAAAVGAMMCVLMRVRDPDALARACDLGVAMQLTNIARDVGEDLRAGRIYLPTDWLAEAGLSPEALIAAPAPSEPLALLVRRLLSEADRLYIRAASGVAALPPSCRPGILSARHVYAAIGGAVARNGHDTVSRRARTSGGRKLALLGLSAAEAGLTLIMPRSAVLHAPPLDETAFLVEAAARAAKPETGRAEGLIALLAQLETLDRRRRTAQG
ncbi:MAG: phytoene/squalene synthase family protein [Paracoccaceae bacterium]|nr:phytoene/squalene synthase family protein [Paracoccaceae bacterium]